MTVTPSGSPWFERKKNKEHWNANRKPEASGHSGFRFAFLVLCSILGCSAPPPPSEVPTAKSASVALSRAAFGPTGPKAFARIAIKRFQLDVELPDPDGWHPVRGKSRFVELTHVSGSRLLLRTWFDDDNMDRRRCEAGARLYRDLPRGGEILAREPLATPEGFDTEVVVGRTPGPPPQSYLNAFGARARRCFAFSFATDAAADDRIALIRERTLGTLRLTSGIDIDPREKLDEP